MSFWQTQTPPLLGTARGLSKQSSADGHPHPNPSPKEEGLTVSLPSLLLLVFTPLLSGCVAALLPLAAVGAIGKGEIDRAKAKRDMVASGAVDLAPAKTASVELIDDGAVITIVKDYDGQGGMPESADILDQFQPAGEFFSPYKEFANYAQIQADRFEAGGKVSSVVLEPSFSLDEPKTISCGGKPLAVLIDLDGEDKQDWLNAETIYRQNGLVEALDKLRASKVSVIWNSDLSGEAAGRLASILHEAKLSAAEADDFLFLDRGGDDRKQARRWDAARNYCIIAMAGDKRSDFDELYDYLLKPDGAAALDFMYDAGWFITPPPLVTRPDGPKVPNPPKEPDPVVAQTSAKEE